MKVTKWVEIESQEVQVEIGADDIRAALDEAFSRVDAPIKRGEFPNERDVLLAFNSIAFFLDALTDEQISMLKPGQISFMGSFLSKQADRFKIPAGMA